MVSLSGHGAEVPGLDLVVADESLAQGGIWCSDSAALFLVSFCYAAMIMPPIRNWGVDPFLVMLLVWCADSGAYFVGRTLGRHKMLPAVSPKRQLKDYWADFFLRPLWPLMLLLPASFLSIRR